MAKWFETKVRYDKVSENGVMKKVTEQYLVDAVTCAEAEARIAQELSPYIVGELTVPAVKSAKINEIFWPSENAEKWYAVKAAFISLDENSGAEKRNTCNYLVKADDFLGAFNFFREGMSGTLADYDILSISESAIVEVYKTDAIASALSVQERETGEMLKNC